MQYITDPETGHTGPSVRDCQSWEECRHVAAMAEMRHDEQVVRRRARRVKPTEQLDLFGDGADETGNLVLNV